MNEKTIIDINQIKSLALPKLHELVQESGIENLRQRKADLVFSYLKKMSKTNQEAEFQAEGVLDIMQDGYGFLRSEMNSYRSEPDDIYVSPNQIKRFSLKTGDVVCGKIRPPKDSERYFALSQVLLCGGLPADKNRFKIDFESLTPLFPDERIVLPRSALCLLKNQL